MPALHILKTFQLVLQMCIISSFLSLACRAPRLSCCGHRWNGRTDPDITCRWSCQKDEAAPSNRTCLRQELRPWQLAMFQTLDVWTCHARQTNVRTYQTIQAIALELRFEVCSNCLKMFRQQDEGQFRWGCTRLQEVWEKVVSLLDSLCICSVSLCQKHQWVFHQYHLVHTGSIQNTWLQPNAPLSQTNNLLFLMWHTYCVPGSMET